MRAQPIDSGPTIPLWDDAAYFETELEAKLAASLKMQQREPVATSPEIYDRPAPPPTPIRSAVQSNDTTYEKLIAGCGIATIDAYLAIRDYASSKSLSLTELKANGFDLQDMLSTLIINHQKAEQPRRNWGNR